MLDVSALFDENYYLAANPDVAAAVASGDFSNGFEHFNLFGNLESRDPSALFDASEYRDLNTDVAAAIEAGIITALDHFLNVGQFENRNPQPLFDTGFYLAQNPDVAAAIARDELTAYQHFVMFGQLEGRDPSLLLDTDFYLQQNPDVVEAIANGTIASAFEHFSLFGSLEERASTAIDPREDLSSAADLGAIADTQTVTDFVGAAEPTDIYRFSLGANSSLNVVLDGLAADADLELIQDLNGNGSIGFDDVFASSTELGTSAETININTLAAGTYFLRISQFEGDTNYTLTLSATPI